MVHWSVRKTRMASHADIWDTSLQLASEGTTLTVEEVCRRVSNADESDVQSVLQEMNNRGWLRESSVGYKAGKKLQQTPF